MATKRKKKANAGTKSTAFSKFDERTPQEVADNLRKEARRIEGYRNKPEVRRAIARNPQVLKDLLEMEGLAAEYRKMADDFEAKFGHLSAAEFAAVQSRADDLARERPEMWEQAQRKSDAGNAPIPSEANMPTGQEGTQE